VCWSQGQNANGFSHFSHKWGWTETLSFEFLAGGAVVVVLALLTNLG
jgi:hypothetical protein